MRILAFAVALATAAPALAQGQAPEARGLHGAPTMVVAQQLGRKGFQMGRSYSSRGVVRTYFMHPNTGRCLLQTARNNQTISIDEMQTRDCTGGSAQRPSPAPPGYQPGPGGADIYREFIGMRSRTAEQELRRRGYRQARAGAQQYWWHPERGLCASVYVAGGYVRQMVQEDPRACGRNWR